MYDARMCFGVDCALPTFQYADIAAVIRTLDKYRIEKAFLSSFASFRLHPLPGNAMTFEAAARDKRLVPCPAILPDCAGEIGDEAHFVDGLIGRGARCVGFYPKSMSIALDRRILGGLFGVLQQRRLPVLLPAGEAGLLEAAMLAEWYPALPVLYAGHSYRHRNLIPLLKAQANLRLVICAPYSANQGLDRLVAACGADQLLFGSNFPLAEPGSAISFLMYSGLPRATVEAIATGNMARLIKEVNHA